MNRVYDKLYNFKAGNKFFFPLNIYRLAVENVKPFKRETAFLFAYPYSKLDTTVFQLPAGFTLESVHVNKEVKMEAGFYKRTCSYDKTLNQLTIVSSLALKQHVIPAEAYARVVSFFMEVTALEEESFVLIAPAGFN